MYSYYFTNQYEVSTVEVKEAELTPSLSVFLNPTNDYITLQINDHNHQKLTYQLFDMWGKIVLKETIFGKQTQFDMSRLLAATYFIQVNQENKKVQSFKIIRIPISNKLRLYKNSSVFS